jgi:hypothetical protein
MESLLEYISNSDRVHQLVVKGGHPYTFTASIATDGTITQPATQQVENGYTYHLHEVRCWGNFTSGSFGNAALLTFDVAGDSGQRPIIDDTPFSALLSPLGSMHPIHLRVPRRFVAGEIIKVSLALNGTWTPDGALVVTCGVALVGDLIADRPKA